MKDASQGAACLGLRIYSQALSTRASKWQTICCKWMTDRHLWSHEFASNEQDTVTLRIQYTVKLQHVILFWFPFRPMLAIMI